jgi:hypothetical protein
MRNGPVQDISAAVTQLQPLLTLLDREAETRVNQALGKLERALGDLHRCLDSVRPSRRKRS